MKKTNAKSHKLNTLLQPKKTRLVQGRVLKTIADKTKVKLRKNGKKWHEFLEASCIVYLQD